MTNRRINLTPLRRLAFPFALLMGALILKYAVTTPSELQPLLDWLAWIVLGIALLQSAYGGHARLFTLTTSLLLVYYIVGNHLQVSLLESSYALQIYSLISIVLPLQLLFLLWVPDRGLWNRYGMIVVSSLPILILAAVLILLLVPEVSLLQFIENYLPAKPTSGYILSRYASLGFLVVLLVGIVKLLIGDNEHDAALVMTVLLMFLLLALFDRPGISDMTFSLAGITLIFAMVRESYQLAYLDDLTGLPARRALNARLKTLGKRYAIAMIDIDHFKKFNDTYGHDTGDDVLKMVAKHIAAVGGGGTAYRYGGEEFCIVFPGADDAEVCTPFLDSVRLAVEKYQMIVRDQQSRQVSLQEAQQRRGRRASNRGEKKVSVTISIGVAGPDEETESPEDVLKAADEALFKAKKKGRNRLVAH